jgi:hypothetical protein
MQRFIQFGDDVLPADGVGPRRSRLVGTQGIDGTEHTFAQTAAGGDGSVGFVGTFTLNAPTSTGVGAYTGTVTFTVG